MKPADLERAGLLWTWWSGDPLPPLPGLPGIRIDRLSPKEPLPAAFQLDPAEADRRFKAGQIVYAAWIDAEPVAYGWAAAKQAQFGFPPVKFKLTPANRYLFDFATLPAWRGHGIYPRLLQTIIKAEQFEARRFWIMHQFSNHASARGIAKAGFSQAADICFLPSGGLGLVSVNAPERASAGAQLLGLPLLTPG